MVKAIFKKTFSKEALMQEDLFRRRATVHKLSLLVMPPLVPVNIFQLPRNTALHYISLDGISKGPRVGDWEIRSVERKMPMQQILELRSFMGNPVKMPANFTTEYDMYLRGEKIFRKSRDVTADDPGETGVIIFNYAYLPRLYRYTRTIFTEYYRWFNIFSTVLQTAVESTTQRTHFINLTLPQKIPGHMQMLKLVQKPPAATVRELRDPNAWPLLEFWKWVNPATREKSLFNLIPEDKLSKFSVLIEDAGKVMTYNLATLDSFALRPNEKAPVVKEDEDSEEPAKVFGTKNRIKGVDIQKRLLYSCLNMVSLRPESASTMDEAEYIEQEYDDGQSQPMLLDPEAEPEITNVIRPSAPFEDPQREVSTTNIQANAEEEKTIAEREQAILASLDDDIEAHDKIIEESIVKEEAQATTGDNINERADNAKVQSFSQEKKPVLDYLADKVETAADRGTMSAVDYRKFNRHIENAANLESPYEKGVLASEFSKVEPVTTEIAEVELAPDSPTLVDKSMRKKVFKELNEGYVEKFLKKDIVGCVQAVQRGGYIVTSHTVAKTETVGGGYENHEIRIVPLEGVPSTISVKSVVVQPDGKIKMGGNDFRYRWQRVDLPILKISPTRVGLSSYYGKNFVIRSERAAYNYNRWLQKQINLKIQEGGKLSGIRSGDVFDFEVSLPRAYTAVAQSWKGFIVDGIEMHFDYRSVTKLFAPDSIEYLKGLKMVPFGRKKSEGVIYAMDDNNSVYRLKDGNLEPEGSFEAMLGIVEDSKPVEFTACKLLGKEIPTGMVLGYYYGLSSLIKMLGVQPRQIPAGTRANLGPDEWSLVFEDYTLVFNTDNKVATLILSGFNQAAKALRKYSLIHFDQPAVYFNVLESMGLAGRYIREFDCLRDMFVDPITERVLVKMGEPTTYPELIKRATELLVDEKHKRPLDPTGSRYRGSERVAGAFYTQLVKSVREHRAKAARNNSKLDIKPFAVWKHITTDSTLTMVRDINPIHNLKEITAMTYSGHGGRNARSMTRTSRGMDPNDLGTLSEATVDSTDVGFNANLSMCPRIANLEGMVLDPIGTEAPPASLLSPAALAAPGINSDDAKRIAIAAIQHTHTVACKGYKPSPIRSGFEKTMAHMVDQGFASTAKQDGVVKSKNKHGIVVQYKDGTEESIAIGQRFGFSAGMVMPHEMATAFEEGEAFKAGTVLVYDSGFFKPDRLNKSEVNWMNGTIANIGFIESKKTHEDSSSISASLSETLGTSISRIKNVMVRFDQVVHNLVQEGDTVNYDDPVCIIEDGTSAAAGLFDEESLNTLKSVDADAPLAGVTGSVDRVEVYYNGHMDDMTESLQEIVRKADNRLARRRKAAGLTVVTGQEDEGFNVEGTPLSTDLVCIRIFFTKSVGAGVGDKIVFGHQLKSEISEVYQNPITMLDGTPVDGFYGAVSLFGRNVYSAFQVGTSIKSIQLISKKMADVFKGKK